MLKKLMLASLIFSHSSFAGFEPKILGVSFGASSIGADPGVKLELTSPYFIRGQTALNFELAGYGSAISSSKFYGVAFLGTKSRFHSNEFMDLNFKTNLMLFPASDLSENNSIGLNYGLVSFFKVPDSSMQIQAEIGYSLPLTTRADKLNNQLFGSGAVVYIVEPARLDS